MPRCTACLCTLLLCAAAASETVDVAADGAATPVRAPGPLVAALTKRTVNASALLSAYQISTTAHSKGFAGETLAYVTPWNGGGYNVAKQYAGKFDWISPVWLQVRDHESDANDIQVTGQHDIDKEWMAAVRSNCSAAGVQKCPLFVPRVVWEARRGGSSIFTRAASLIASVVKKQGFDGITFEAPLHPQFTPLLTVLASQLHAMKPTPELKRWAAAAQGGAAGSDGDAALSSSAIARSPAIVGRALVLVLPPRIVPDSEASSGQQQSQSITPKQFVSLAGIVDRFSLMTYDYSQHAGATMGGPNCPIKWMRETVEGLLGGAAEAKTEGGKAKAARILMGLPFYGYDNRDAILGHQWVSLLTQHPEGLKADRDAVEHYVRYKEQGSGAYHRAFYPTPWMLSKRLQLADALGMGISIWEIGQGLPYFYDLL